MQPVIVRSGNALRNLVHLLIRNPRPAVALRFGTGQAVSMKLSVFAITGVVTDFVIARPPNKVNAYTLPLAKDATDIPARGSRTASIHLLFSAFV